MLIHLGGGISVPMERIVLMANMVKGLSQDTVRLKDRLDKAGSLRRIGNDPSTFVLLTENHREIAYMTSVGLRTLQKRWKDTEYRLKEVLL